MRIFVTGATGFIGSRVVTELIAAGHEVLGMTRSDAGAHALAAAGAQPYRASLEDLDSVAKGAAGADAVIHTAFDHDFSRYVENCEQDARVIRAIGTALARRQPFIVTAATSAGSTQPAEIATEDVVNLDEAFPRSASERAADEVNANGGSVAVVRLPQVHDPDRQGLISFFIEIARRAGVCGYIGDGTNRWCAGHVDDVARVYRLALERHRPGARWHAVGEEGVPFRDIAEVVGASLGIPVRSFTPDEARAYFGWMADFAAANMVASSTVTRARLSWQPTGPSLIEDLRAMDYSRDEGL